MNRFTELFITLDQTNKTAEKTAAMSRYFREVPPADGAWALFFLSGQRLRSSLKTRVLRETALSVSGLPSWMFNECYDAVGDLSETVSLLLPPRTTGGMEEPLHELVERRILPLLRASAEESATMLSRAWAGMRFTERLVFNKLLRGNFRVGVNRSLVVRALSQAIGVESAVLAHRLSGGFSPTAAAFLALALPGGEADAARPFPFCLAHQLDRSPAELGDPRDWQIEFKWDGIRAQIVRRKELDRGVAIWSRGEEPIADQFPDIQAAARALPEGTVLDGEILAWRFGRGGSRVEGAPLSFNVLQTHLNRKNVQASLFDMEGVVFAAFDILEEGGRDVRAKPLRERRFLLERTIGAAVEDDRAVLRLPPIIECSDWAQAQAIRVSARDSQGAEGLMLKHQGSHYHTGRIAGGTVESVKHDGGAHAGWWKWKVDPYSVDAVLIYAQLGTGKRAGLFTDYTFGVWDLDLSGALVAFAKAYSGLDNEEIRRVDAFVRGNTMDRRGPVRLVRPELVFEISFESIRESPRHKAGIAVRFPRITRWRHDKTAGEADSIEAVRALLKTSQLRDAKRMDSRASSTSPNPDERS